MKRLVALLLIFILSCLPSLADNTLPLGFPQDNYLIPSGAAQYLTLAADSTLTSERILSPTARFIVTDNGAGGTYVLELATVGTGYGGTGATTAQGGFNNLANATAGAAVASGDVLYYNGTNWARLAKGSDGNFLTLASGLPSWGASPAGAPAGAQYLTLALDGGLSAERVLTAGSGIGFTDTGADGTLTVAVDSTVIRTTGAQSMSGPKTLSGGPIISGAQTNGLVLAGSSFSDTILITDPAANRNYTIPDSGTNASFVMTEGAQTVNGVKTFGSAPKLSTNTLTSSTGNTITIPNSTDTLVNLTGSQTLTNKTLTAPIFSSNSFTLQQSGGNYTVQWANPAAGRVYTVEDVNGNANFAMNTNGTLYTAGGIPYGDGNSYAVTSAGTSGQAFISGGTGAPSFGTLGAAGGGTGLTSYTAGDLLYATGATTLAKLGIGANGKTLQVVLGAPAWADGGTGTVTSVGLSFSGMSFISVSGSPVTTSGTLTGTASGTTGDILYFSGASTISKLGIGSSGNVLTVSGGVPAWAAPSGGAFTISSKTAGFTASDGANYYYRISTNSVTVTLPASPADGSVRKFKVVTAGKTATFVFNGAETINHADGTSDQVLTLDSTSGVLELTAVSGGWDET